MTRLLVIRPEPGATASVAKARAMGLDAEAMPLFEVRAVKWEIPEDAYDGLVLTSANALRHGGAGLDALKHLPVHAVGEATAAAARDEGFNVATIGAGDGGDLMRMISGGRLLHLCGRAHRALPGVEAVVVYEAAALDFSGGIDVGGAVVAVHSPRGGARLAELAKLCGTTSIAAISEAAAAACGGGWQSVAVADAPTDDAVLALAARLCQNSGR